MRFVAGAFKVMTLGEAVTALADGKLPPRALVITFDDGYADNAEVALPILLRHGLKASFFVSTGFLDGGRMWNDSVIACVGRCAHQVLDLESFGLGQSPMATLAMRRSVINALLPKIKYLGLEERQTAIARLSRLAGATDLPSNLMMSSAQVRQLRSAGMEIGGHTVNHPILAAIEPDLAEQELAQGKHELEVLLDAPVDVFAYPNGRPGRDYDSRHVAMAKKLGFRGAVSTAMGVSRPGDDLFQLPRFTPWQASLPHWGARLVLNQRNTKFDRA